jgi:enoyl-CoA hydratase/carnithine racemase
VGRQLGIAFTRTPTGVLTLRFHTEGGPATFTGHMHSDLPRALYEIGDDRDNQVLVLTGTGDRFMTEIDGQSLDDPTKPAVWDKTTAEGRRIMQRLVDLERAERWGAAAEVLPLEEVLPRAQELAETLAARPQLLTRYLAVTVRQRLSRRMAEGYLVGSALEGLTGADLAYQHG